MGRISLLLLLILTQCLQLSAQENALFKFGIIADVQYSDKDHSNSRHYRSSLNKLREAVTSFNNEKVDFVVSLGDFINDDFKSFDSLNSIVSKLEMPLRHVLGNHEFAVAEPVKTEVLQKLGLTRNYYSFSKKRWKFIILDGNEVSLYANSEGSSAYLQANNILAELKRGGSPNAQSWNGTLSQMQLAWLQQQLKQAKRKKQQVLLFSHFPIFPDNSMYTMWNSKEIRKVLEAFSHVHSFFSGHTHKSNYVAANGLNHLTLRGMVEREDNAFAIVHVYPDRLEVRGYGLEPNRVLKKVK